MAALRILRSLSLIVKSNASVPHLRRAFGTISKSNQEYMSKTSLFIELTEKPGSLLNVLKYFHKYDINLTHIESRPNKKKGNSYDFFVDFEENGNKAAVDELLRDLKGNTQHVVVLDGKKVPWYPQNVGQLDLVAGRTLDAGEDLQSDHPGFGDAAYRKRREDLARAAREFRHGDKSPLIFYSSEERATWGTVRDRLVHLHEAHACEEHLAVMRSLSKHCPGYNLGDLSGPPQIRDVSEFLQAKTGFRLRPVAGLLSSRDFLNALALRVFCCTQYIRHPSKPLYTPEPDIIHELMGHAPLFADPDFADFSQEIGLASLGASDEDVQRLASCYWHSVEFGLCRQEGQLKAWGAGLLSSLGELEYACSPKRPAGGTNDVPEYLPWDPHVASTTEYPITAYQPKYFVARSLVDAKDKMRHFCDNLKRPFYARYNTITESVWVDRAVKVCDLEASEAA